MSWVVEPSIEVCANQCGAACCRAPGYLDVLPDEEHLFAGVLIQHIEGHRRIVFQDIGGRCVHLQPDNLCGIYDTRPQACRGFPYEPTAGCLVWPSDQPMLQLQSDPWSTRVKVSIGSAERVLSTPEAKSLASSLIDWMQHRT